MTCKRARVCAATGLITNDPSHGEYGVDQYHFQGDYFFYHHSDADTMEILDPRQVCFLVLYLSGSPGPISVLRSEMLPLDLNLSQCKTFQYFMQMRAKSICEFWMPIEASRLSS